MTNRYPKQNNENGNSSSDYVKNLREELRKKTNYQLEKAEEKYGNADEVYQEEVREIIANAQENVRGNLMELVRKLEESNLEQDEILKRLKGKI
jgi:gas vesicle protein